MYLTADCELRDLSLAAAIPKSSRVRARRKTSFVAEITLNAKKLTLGAFFQHTAEFLVGSHLSRVALVNVPVTRYRISVIKTLHIC